MLNKKFKPGNYVSNVILSYKNPSIRKTKLEEKHWNINSI